jgi:hypothetical protein
MKTRLVIVNIETKEIFEIVVDSSDDTENARNWRIYEASLEAKYGNN